MFDGSSIDGFTRIEESDMLLVPDKESLLIYPEDIEKIKTARMICDVHNADNTPFSWCPRTTLKKIVDKVKSEMNMEMFVWPEPEFFLFDSLNIMKTNDNAWYFDLAPLDKWEEIRKEMTLTLQKLGFEIEASHHEVAPWQHEIDFKYDTPINTADNIATFMFIIKKIAQKYWLHATFLPKPVFGINGSGMHIHQSLFKDEKNMFYDEKKEHQLSDTALYYIWGIMKHAKAITAIANPTINSYKRLVPWYEAPTNIARSLKNRSPLIRVPSKRGNGTRIELRSPDPAANPYLLLAVCLAAWVDGIKNKIQPPTMIDKNIFTMSEKDKQQQHIEQLPWTLYEALKELEKDDLIKEVLWKHIYNHFYTTKMQERAEYSSQISNWELEKYKNI